MTSSRIAILACGLSLCACDASTSHSSQHAEPHADNAHVCSAPNDCASARDTESPRTCSLATHRCTPILNADCALLSGPHADPRAVWLGSLSSLHGASAAADRARQRAVSFAVERVNEAGGVPVLGKAPRPLVLVGCDASADVRRAARHLVRDLGVRAIVGPTASQDTLELAQRFTIREGALLITPTAMASGIDHLLDDDLVWGMVPSTSQRAAWMRDRLELLAARVTSQRGDAPLKLGVVYRDDALGVDLRTGFLPLSWNGKPLADPENLGNRVRIAAYDPEREDQNALVEAQLEFQPDVLVLAGGAEAVTQILGPLERAWSSDTRAPHYVLTDAAKVPELLELAGEVEGLAARIHGTGDAPSSESEPVHDAFLQAYQQRFPGSSADVSGLAAGYDAVLALALAAAGLEQEHPSGAELAAGLRAALAGGAGAAARTDQPAAALRAAASGEPLEVLGTLGRLRWDDDGAPADATLESWCVEDRGAPEIVRSGASFDVASQGLRSPAVRCGEAESARTATSPGMASATPPPTAVTPPPPAASDAGVPSENPDAAVPDASAGQRDAAAPAAPDAGPPVVGSETLLTAVRRDTNWANGYCDRVALYNFGDAPVEWIVDLMVLGTLTSVWSCKSDGDRGRVTFRGADWNRIIAPEATTEFGFCATLPSR